MKKLIYVVCGLNASRSQAIEEFLKGKYSNPEVEIKSAGLDVNILGEEDKRTLFTKELAEKANIILVSDHDKLYRIKYNLLKNNDSYVGKIHLLRIPDVFHPHKNSYMPEQGHSYEEYIQKIESELEFKKLIEYIKELNPRETSILTEAIYTKELYTSHLSPELRQDKKYPFELLHKTLEFRFSWISKLIEN